MMRTVFSPDGSHFARMENGNRIHLHESATGKLLHSIAGSAPRAFDAATWCPYGKFIAIGGRGEILIHRTNTGELHKRIPQGSTDVSALAWSPDGKWIVAANRDGKPEEKILLHSVNDNSPPVQLPGDAAGGDDTRFSFSPDSKSLAVFSTPGTGSYYWDIEGSRIDYRQDGHDHYNGITHSPDGKLLAACGLNNLLILDAKSGEQVFRHQDESINSHIWSLAFSPDGCILAFGVEDRIKFIDTRSWKEINPSDDLNAPVTALTFSADGRHLVTGGLDGDLLLWDWEKKSPVWKRFSPPDKWGVDSISIDPSGHWIGVAQNQRHPEPRKIYLVDFATGETRKYLPIDFACVVAPLFSKTSPAVFVPTSDHSLVEWDYEEDQAVRTIPVHFLRGSKAGEHHKIRHLDFDPADPKLIRWEATQASGRIHTETLAESGTVDSNHVIQETNPIPPRTHEFVHNGSDVWNLPSLHQARPDGRSENQTVANPSGLLLFSSNHSEVEVFDLLSLTIIHRFSFGNGDLKSIALSPDGKTLVAATTGGLHYVSLPETREFPDTVTSETLWQIMGGENHWEAYQAAWALARQLDFLTFVEGRVVPAHEPTPEETKLLETLLKDGNHLVRQHAARKWLDLGLSLDSKTYGTLREDGLPEVIPSKPLFTDDRPFLSFERQTDPIPLLTPLSEHRRIMRAVMILLEDQSPESFHHLQHLASGHPTAPLAIAAKKAIAIRSNRDSSR